ncbi:MAG: NAD(+)/NADH kinase [Coriobacteriales bacterium]|nr:NAD(+)/NADH kinase [Coriobacteriales bacterium]
MRILLIDNVTNDQAIEAMRQVGEWLARESIAYDSASGLDLSQFAADIDTYDLICTFGGDGTILRAVQLIGSSGVPLLSYNFGQLGFLAGAAGDDIIPAIKASISGQAQIDARTMLSARVEFTDGTSLEQLGLNELAVTRGNFGRIVALDLEVNGTPIDTVRGDGMLVSTPTGSTAYALSAGGPLIAPGYEGLCVVPISPHSLNTRAIIIAPGDVISLRPNSRNRQPLALFIDGQDVLAAPAGTGMSFAGDDGVEMIAGSWPAQASDTTQSVSQAQAADPGQVLNPVRNIERIEIRTSSHKLKLLRPAPYDFYDHIAATFFRSNP